MSINAYNASTISALFAGLNNSSSGTSLSYGIDFTTYNSIKNGSYSKLMRKYYSNQASESTNGATANKNTGKVHSIDIQKNNATVNRDNAASLVDSASELKKYLRSTLCGLKLIRQIKMAIQLKNMILIRLQRQYLHLLRIIIL